MKNPKFNIPFSILFSIQGVKNVVLPHFIYSCLITDTATYNTHTYIHLYLHVCTVCW